MKNVAIVGSNGFIGYHLTNKLSQNPEVNLLLFGRNATSVFGESFPYKQLDLLNKEQISNNFKDVDTVFYLASATIPATSWDNPEIELKSNLIPFLNFMECICKLKIKKIIFLSSAGTIYGTYLEKVNEASDKNPFSPYGIIKLTMEHFLNYFKVKYDIQYEIFRVSNVYGEGQNTSKGLGIINTFIEKIIKGEEIEIFGDGNNTRNYVYVKDVAELLSYSLNQTTESDGVFNIASNDTVSINNLVVLLKGITKEKVNVLRKEKRLSDNSIIDIDNSKILKAYPGFKFTSIKDGVTQTYLHLKTTVY
ncbi:MAG: NAD-dependent epimerase/dehydratase [Bacteroidota bacterium]|jgi:UDP-glucose 4-epimerase|nr:NAD-dependent epimerase/dehydratase [Bacteroidota bacterium]